MKVHSPFFSKSQLRCSLFIAFFVSLSFCLRAQTAPVKLWDKTFGGSGDDFLSALQQTSDGGYILGGQSDSNISGDKSQTSRGGRDFWVIKSDASGNKAWDKTLGGNSNDKLWSLKQTSDGGYILGGTSDSGISGDKSQNSKGPIFTFDYWVVKLDINGNKLWDKTLGGFGNEHLYCLQQTSDGGYILGGASGSGISGDKSQASQGALDYWLVKLDANGNKTWDKTIGGSNHDWGYSVQQTSDGGYILGGYSDSGISGDKSQTNKGANDYWVVKLNANGIKMWDKTLGGSGNDELSWVQQTSDGGYILGGGSDSGISGDKTQANRGIVDLWVVKLDSSGNKIWDKTFGGSAGDYLQSVQQTSDGGYILGGTSNSGISGDKSQVSNGFSDYWVVKLDTNGIKLWDKAFGGSNWDQLSYAQQTADGSYILGGSSPSGISGDKSQIPQGLIDFWVIKLGVPCAPTPIVIPGSNCGAGSVTLSATGAPAGGSYVWYNVASGGTPLYSNPSGMFVTPNLSTSTTYYVAATNSAGCEGLRSPVTATINLFTVTVGSAQSICASASPVQLSGFNPAGGTWSGPGVNAAGIFTPSSSLLGNQILSYTVTQNGCTASATQVITVTAPPTVIAGSSQSICTNAAPIQLTGFSPAGGTWSGPGVSLSGLFTPDNSLSGTQNLTYSVTQNGCTVNATKDITVIKLPSVNVGANETICANSSPVQLSGFSPIGGTWSGAGVSSSGVFTPDSSLVGNQTLTYTVTQNGCTASAKKQVTVQLISKVSLGADIIACDGEEITLNPESPSGTYLWSDGSNGTSLKVRQSGDYWVKFVMDGCETTDTIRVTLKKCPEPFIPNITTPNNDGKNDTFSPQYLPAGRWQLQIFNRWGVKLFETENYQDNWPDKKIVDGTYYYLLRNSETGQQYKGWVEVAQ